MLQDIPATVLAKFFSYLPEEYVKKEVKLVCKRWYEIVQDHYYPANENSKTTPTYEELCEISIKNMERYDFTSSLLKKMLINQPPRKRNNRIKTEVKEKYISKFEQTSIKNENILETSPVIKFGTGSERLNMSIRTFDNIHELFDEILFRRPKVQPCQISHLNIKLINKSDDDAANPIYLSNIAKVIGGGLESLSIQDSSCSLQNQCFEIRSSEKYNYSCFLRSIKIVSPNSTMTKICLRYLISSKFGSLDDLQLFLKLEEPHDGREDIIWAQLKSFCSVKLEKYNIFFRDEGDGSKLFSYDNCKMQETTYEDRYKNFDSSDTFTLIDNNRQGYLIKWENDWS